jgi:hypothetical protein
MMINNPHWRVVSLATIFLISPVLAHSSTADLAAVGPLDQVNCAKGTFRVLGTTFVFGPHSAIFDLCTGGITGLKYVVVLGHQSGKAIADDVSELHNEMYVPGASSVFLRGAVSRVDRMSGQFEIAGTTVVGVFANPPHLGSTVDVVGTQPVPGGVVLAEAVYPTAPAENATDTNTSNAIIGSGKNANAIIGSGAGTSAIIGSGKSASAIIGSGSSTSAIIGSGKNTSAIIGSGAEAKAIIGSGKSTNAIIGSGASVNAIIGSGKSTTAIIGSGTSARAIIGSGAAKN